MFHLFVCTFYINWSNQLNWRAGIEIDGDGEASNHNGHLNCSQRPGAGSWNVDKSKNCWFLKYFANHCWGYSWVLVCSKMYVKEVFFQSSFLGETESRFQLTLSGAGVWRLNLGRGWKTPPLFISALALRLPRKLFPTSYLAKTKMFQQKNNQKVACNRYN